jgi:hypothetical protein
LICALVVEHNWSISATRRHGRDHIRSLHGSMKRGWSTTDHHPRLKNT